MGLTPLQFLFQKSMSEPKAALAVDDGKGSTRHGSSRRDHKEHEGRERRASAAPASLAVSEKSSGDRTSVGPAAGGGIRKSMAPTKAVSPVDKDRTKVKSRCHNF